MGEVNLADRLINYDFNHQIIQNLLDSGFNKLRKIQRKALDKGLFEKKSFLVIAPSGSGKTLIGEFGALHTVQHTFKKSVYLVPLRSLAFEKFNQFKKLYSEIGIDVVVSVGDMEIPRSKLEGADILILTYEKMDSLLRNRKNDFLEYTLGTVIIDEIHILGDSHRGGRLESLIVSLYQLDVKPQIIGLSATIGNPKALISWLSFLERRYRNSELVYISNNERPIELKYSLIKTPNKPLKIFKIVKKCIEMGSQILIFTNSRRKTKKFAEKILARHAKSLMQYVKRSMNTNNYKKIISQIKSNKDISKQIRDICLKGISFHHAGLKQSEKTLIEYLFKEGFIKIIVTTSTLSAGVNLPARFVILEDYCVFNVIEKKIQSPNTHSSNEKLKINANGVEQGRSEHGSFTTKKVFQKVPIDNNLFHQICGRAGRPGLDDLGRAFILVEDWDELQWVKRKYFEVDGKNQLIPKYQDLTSKLIQNQNILEEIVLLTLYKFHEAQKEEIIEYMKNMFSFFDNKKGSIPFEILINMDYMDLFSYLFLMGNHSPLEKFDNFGISVKILDINLNKGSMKIELFIKSRKDSRNGPLGYNVHQITIKKGEGIFCSCNKNNGQFGNHIYRKEKRLPISHYSNHGDNDDYNKNPFSVCEHIHFFLYFIEFGNQNHKVEFNGFKQEYKEFIKEFPIILHDLMARTPVLKNLLDFGLVLEKKKDVENEFDSSMIYTYTALGKLSVNHYFLPCQTYKIKKVLEKLIQSQKIRTKQDTFKIIIKILKIQKINVPPNFFSILMDWINGIPNEQVLKRANAQSSDSKIIYFNDLSHLLERTLRILKFMQSYFREFYPQYNPSYFNEIYQILDRIKSD